MSAEALDFLVTLRGINEVPSNRTSRLGVGGATLNGNLLWYYLEVDLSPQGGGIFGPAPAGANGASILQFANYGFLPPWPDAGG
jgi:hypothetical protein